MKFLYSLSFLLGADNWKIEPTPQEVTGSLEGFARDNTTILDLGCGDGYHSLTLAKDGWNVIGVDYVPLAVRRACRAAQKAGLPSKRFHCGRTYASGALSACRRSIFAYDIGCFHLLDTQQEEEYIRGLANVMKSGGLFLLKAFTPRPQGKKTVGYESEEIGQLFSSFFTVEKTSNRSYWRFPARWYWMRRK
jgi:cyclopropane fatty-acyl-phospholipid synthase-like methyltransferase